MLSRVVERLYWSGRYMERAEDTSRLVQTYADLLLDLPKNSGAGWSRILRILNARADFDDKYEKLTERNVIRYLIADADNANSVLSCISQVRENFRTLRDVVPKEGWEHVNEYYLFAQTELDRCVGQPRRRHQSLVKCIAHSQRLSGLLAGTMSRGHGYSFLSVGSLLERVDMTSRVVDVAAATLARQADEAIRFENTLWMAVLKSLSAYQMYRQNVRRRVTADDVVTFLLTDEDFPRGIAWGLSELHSYLNRLPNNKAATEIVRQLEHQVPIDLPNLSNSLELHEYLVQLQQQLASLHMAIDVSWFLEKTNTNTPANS